MRASNFVEPSNGSTDPEVDTKNSQISKMKTASRSILLINPELPLN